MTMDITEALTIVAARNMPPEMLFKIGAGKPSDKLYETALKMINYESLRLTTFYANFGDMSGDN